MSRLEQIGVEGFWEAFLLHNPPPPDMTPRDLQLAKDIFLSGFGAMFSMAEHLHNEPPEVRAAILANLRRQLEPQTPNMDLN
jgi:hypothetical protein